ncbi:MAG: tetraacyldisaccharide 4'-kinase [Pseudomonadota bacterium]
MQAPAFWQAPAGISARLLSPFGAIYAAATGRRLRRAGLRLDIPVICVGNLTVGGSGKTPTVIALAERLCRREIAVHILLRGYGGRLAGPLQVDPQRHDAAAVGDEALLMSAYAPVWVARDRAAGGLAAARAGAQAILLDDGFQNPALQKDLSLLVVDAEAGFGNGFCIPAGPMREPVAAGLARADLVLILGPAAARAQLLETWPVLREKPVLTGGIRPRDTGMSWAGQPVVAFAGIGRPEKFFATMRDLGAQLVGQHGLGDHQPFTPRLLTRLQREAQAKGAMLVTTDKDAVRLPRPFHGLAVPVPVALETADWPAIDNHLNPIFATKLPG